MGYANMTVKEFISLLQSKPETYFNSREELAFSFENALYNVINPRLSQLFRTLPDTNFT